MISDGKARRIAAEWQAPNSPGLASLATSGAIIPNYDDSALQADLEIDREVALLEKYEPTGYTQESLRDLRALQQYVQVSGRRERPTGWSGVWDGRAVTTDGTDYR